MSDSKPTQTRPIGTVTFSNTGRVLVVTGGGQGIGRAVAKLWHETGGIAIVLEVNPALRTKVEPWGEFIECDVTSPSSCAAAVTGVVARHGGIDLLVPNAVIEGPESYLQPHEIPHDMWDRYVAVNLTGMQNIGREAIPVMLEQGSGYVVIVSSVQALVGGRISSMYAATKAGTRSLIDTWASSYARRGIRVNGVLPGAILTEGMVPKLEGQGGPKQLGNRHPRGCLGLPEEIAMVVLGLASPIAANVYGSAWRCDGGLFSRPPFDADFDIATCPDQPRASWQDETA